jgi:hypothetical protein
MKCSRRQLLQAGLIGTVVPTLLFPKISTGYAHAEIDERIKSGQGLNGLTKADLTTPCLLLDLDALEANIAKMAAHARATKLKLRPHGKPARSACVSPPSARLKRWPRRASAGC